MEKNYFPMWRKAPKRKYMKAFCLCLFLGSISNYSLAVPKESMAEVTQQTKTVKGTVLDPLGEPIIGANVKVQGGTTGTITDLDGNFSLSVPGGQKIEVSFIGYVTQVATVPASGVVKVTLAEDSKMLEEVVVIGYGTQRVKDLTGAATTVQVADIPDIPGASLVDALAGQVVGLSVSKSSGRPGDTGTFKVRQPVSFDSNSAYNQPLIVIDDVVQVDEKGDPTMTMFNMLDVSEIESMTVLKDASAAVYGSRASAGVILVKTKRGTSGTPKITYSGKLDYADAVSHIKTMNAYELGVFTNRLFKQTDVNSVNPGQPIPTTYSAFKYSDAELEKMKSLNYDWLDEAWSASLSQRHSLTVNGGSDKATYFAGLSYQSQGTNLGDVQDYDKWTFRTGGEIKVASGLKLSASVSGYNTKQIQAQDQASVTSGPWGSQAGSKDYSQLRHVPKYIPMEVDVLDPSTNQMRHEYMALWSGPKNVNTSNDSNVGSGVNIWNFFANEASNAKKTNEENGYDANFSLTYDVPFVKGLSLKATYAVNYSNSYNNSVGDYYTLARARNTNTDDNHLLNTNTTWDFINYGDPYGSDVSKKPTIIYTKSTSRKEQMNFMLNYNRTFGQHDISLTGVVERSEGEGHTQKMTYRGPSLSYTGTSATAGTLDANESSLVKYESGALSYVGRASYKYGDRYLAQFVIRADASTKFAPENYWGTFPTGSLGWVVSEENFFKNSKLSNYVDFLKFRFSLGKTGKDNVDAWKWLQHYKISTSSGTGFGTIGGQNTNGSGLDGVANRMLKWDTTIKQNYGLDLNLLSNRLSASVDFYYDKTHDLIMDITDEEEPIYIGAKMAAQNYGKKDAWGWEFSLRWNDKIEQSLIPSWGAIKYGIGVDYSISWQKTVLGNPAFFDYPAELDNKTALTGWRSPTHEYGFKTWKNTSKGDGMLRTQADIDNYWQYLTDLANAAGISPNYLGVSSKDNMRLGMIAYQDINGDLDAANKTIAGPNGIITRDHGQDLANLASDQRHGINTKLSAQWGQFSWSAQLSTSWGGFESIYHDIRQGANDFIWSQFSYVNDMYDPDENPNGKFPSMAVGSAYGENSDFWQVPSFRMYVRNMSIGYTLPKKLVQKAGIDKLQLSLTGNNLWDFYNPYPDHFRNMYDDCRTGYPTLRTWTLGVNLTF